MRKKQESEVGGREVYIPEGRRALEVLVVAGGAPGFLAAHAPRPGNAQNWSLSLLACGLALTCTELFGEVAVVWTFTLWLPIWVGVTLGTARRAWLDAGGQEQLARSRAIELWTATSALVTWLLAIGTFRGLQHLLGLLVGPQSWAHLALLLAVFGTWWALAAPRILGGWFGPAPGLPGSSRPPMLRLGSASPHRRPGHLVGDLALPLVRGGSLAAAALWVASFGFAILAEALGLLGSETWVFLGFLIAASVFLAFGLRPALMCWAVRYLGDWASRPAIPAGAGPSERQSDRALHLTSPP